MFATPLGVNMPPPTNRFKREFDVPEESLKSEHRDPAMERLLSTIDKKSSVYTNIPTGNDARRDNNHRENTPYWETSERSRPRVRNDRHLLPQKSKLDNCRLNLEDSENDSQRKPRKADKKASKLKKSKYISSDSSNDSSNESDSESDSDEDTKDHRRRGNRPRSPPPPKLETFSGDTGKWKAFIFQFEEAVSAHKWKSERKLVNLKLCLRGKAVEFYQSRPKEVRKSYKKLKQSLMQRYGQKDLPFTVRRQLGYIKQEENETLEEFGDRVLGMTMEGFPTTEDDTVQMMAVDSFFKGCKDKAAAAIALEKEPSTMHEAVQAVKKSVHNQKLVNKSALSTRQVSFQAEKKPSN
jgi:hypothetical protein